MSDTVWLLFFVLFRVTQCKRPFSLTYITQINLLFTGQRKVKRLQMRSRQFTSVSHIMLLCLPPGTGCFSGPQNGNKTCGAVCKTLSKIIWKWQAVVTTTVFYVVFLVSFSFFFCKKKKSWYACTILKLCGRIYIIYAHKGSSSKSDTTIKQWAMWNL